MQRTTLIGGGQRLDNVVDYGLGLNSDYIDDRKETSKLLQKLKRKGLVAYSYKGVWYLTRQGKKWLNNGGEG